MSTNKEPAFAGETNETKGKAEKRYDVASVGPERHLLLDLTRVGKDGLFAVVDTFKSARTARALMREYEARGAS